MTDATYSKTEILLMLPIDGANTIVQINTTIDFDSSDSITRSDEVSCSDTHILGGHPDFIHVDEELEYHEYKPIKEPKPKNIMKEYHNKQTKQVLKQFKESKKHKQFNRWIRR